MKRKTFEYEIEDVGSTPSEDREYLNHAGALGFRLVCIADGRMYLELEKCAGCEECRGVLPARVLPSPEPVRTEEG
jgi:hypothetical protein